MTDSKLAENIYLSFFKHCFNVLNWPGARRVLNYKVAVSA